MTARRLILFAMTFFSIKTWAAGNGVGNPGDGLRVLYRQAKDAVVSDLQTLKSCELDRNPAYDWLRKHQHEMAKDLSETKFEWTSSEQSTCAHTGLTASSPIHLSFEKCRVQPQLNTAMGILVHESVHHFGINDETFADEVAQQFMKALGTKECIDYSAQEKHWENIQLPEEMLNRGYWGFTSTDGGFAIWGGRTMSQPYFLVQGGGIYDLKTKSWTNFSLEGSPSGRYSSQLYWLDHYLVHLGGHDPLTRYKDGFVYNSETRLWKPINPEVTGRKISSKGIALGDSLFLGEFDGPEASCQFILYKPHSDEVIPLNEIQLKTCLDIAWNGDEVFIFSDSGSLAWNPETRKTRSLKQGAPGFAGKGVVAGEKVFLHDFHKFYIYDISTDTWSSKSSFMNLLDSRLVEFINGKIYYFSGLIDNGKVSPLISVLDPLTLEWRELKASVTLQGEFLQIKKAGEKKILFLTEKEGKLFSP